MTYRNDTIDRAGARLLASQGEEADGRDRKDDDGLFGKLDDRFKCTAATRLLIILKIKPVTASDGRVDG